MQCYGKCGFAWIVKGREHTHGLFAMKRDNDVPMWMTLKLSFREIDNPEHPGPLLNWLEKLGQTEEFESDQSSDETDKD